MWVAPSFILRVKNSLQSSIHRGGSLVASVPAADLVSLTPKRRM